MLNSVELRKQRADLVAKARQIVEVANGENRDMSGEEKAQFDAMMADVDSLKSRVDTIEKITAVSEDSAPAPEANSRRPTFEARSDSRFDGNERLAQFATPEYRRAFSHWLSTGEKRDTIIGTLAKGGYLTAPVKLADTIVKALDANVFIRSKAKVVKLTEAASLGIPQMSTRMARPSFTGEVTPVTEDTTMAFARRDLNPICQSKLAKVSIKAMKVAANVEDVITSELTYKFAEAQEYYFLNGSGSAGVEPLGIFTASANGIPAARDITCGTSTAITADKLLDVRYSLRSVYASRPTTGWIFHQDALKAIRKLLDGQNNYLWEPSYKEGTPDTVLGIPVYESEFAPATFTTGLYVGALGDLSTYWIAELDSLEISRVDELFQNSNEVGFYGRTYVDGSPALGEAFVRCKLA